MSLEIIDADVYTFYHVEEVSLEDEGLSRVIQHACGMVQFLEVLESCFYFLSEFKQSVLVKKHQR